MTRVIACPKCQKKYQVPGDPTGKSMKCAACQQVFTVGNTPATAGQGQTPSPVVTATSGAATTRSGLFPNPESVPVGNDPLSNHVVQDPGFAEVDLGEIKRTRLAVLRKNNKLADAYASSSSLDKMADEEKKNKVHNVGYISKDTLFGFDGRIPRKKYWLCTLFAGFTQLAAIGAAFGLMQILLYVNDTQKIPDGFDGLMMIFPVIIVLLISGFAGNWIGIALVIKRFHDLGYPGSRFWFGMIPIYNIWISIQLGFVPGEPDRNKWGPNPLIQNVPKS